MTLISWRFVWKRYHLKVLINGNRRTVPVAFKVRFRRSDSISDIQKVLFFLIRVFALDNNYFFCSNSCWLRKNIVFITGWNRTTQRQSWEIRKPKQHNRGTRKRSIVTTMSKRRSVCIQAVPEWVTDSLRLVSRRKLDDVNLCSQSDVSGLCCKNINVLCMHRYTWSQAKWRVDV